MSDAPIIHVKIGEVKIGKKGETLKAILGSCIGIGFFWKSRQMYGLAHCLLAESPTPTFEIGARFVSQAVPSLLALMKIRPENLAEIEAVVVGGGNMTCPEAGRADMVGTVNARTAIAALRKAGIRVVYEDTGGNSGRQIEIRCATGEYEARTIPRIAA